MTRDQVIEHAKDWLAIMAEAQKWLQYNPHLFEGTQERQDVLNACVDLAYLRTKEALTAYAKEREEKFAAHDRMLETIEQTLKGELSNDR